MNENKSKEQRYREEFEKLEYHEQYWHIYLAGRKAGQEEIESINHMLKFATENAAKFLVQRDQLEAENEHLKDISNELEQNVLAAQDSNHYFNLMSKYRDDNYELQEKIEKLKDLVSRANELMKIQKDMIDHLLGKKPDFGNNETFGFGNRVDKWLKEAEEILK